MDFQIQSATIRDLSSLQKLERACFPRDAWPLLDLIAVLTFPGVIRLKAVVGEHMVGFIAGDPRSSKDLAWIATLAVLPEYRRHGIAMALLEDCESRLCIARIRLCVRASNQAGIQLYQHAGYSITDTWSNYYNDGESAIVMEKNLGDRL